MPAIYIHRQPLKGRIDAFGNSMVATRFPGALALVGCRGIGKSVELRVLEASLLEAGVLPVLVTLGRRLHVEAATVQQLRRVLTERPRRERSSKVTVTGKLPMLEIGYESNREPTIERLATVTSELMESGHVTAVAFLLDEADFMADVDFEDTFAEVLGAAAQFDTPVGLVSAGTSRAYMRTMQGLSTFMSGLVTFTHLSRLDVEASLSLLVDTAGTAGVTWDRDALRDLAEECLGVPRMLQSAGRALFELCEGGRASTGAVAGIVPQWDPRSEPSFACPCGVGGGLRAGVEG